MSEQAVKAAAPPPADGEPAKPKGATLGDLISAYEAASGRASENVRFLAAAGFALVWLLAGKEFQRLTTDLVLDGALLVLALFADFVHYVVQAGVLKHLQHKFEHEGKKRQDAITVPKRRFAFVSALWWTKIAVLVVAYLFLGYSVVTRIAGASASSPAATEVSVCE